MEATTEIDEVIIVDTEIEDNGVDVSVTIDNDIVITVEVE